MRLRIAREQLRNIVNHASTNPKYLEQLRTDPVGVLIQEGLPYDVIEDFLREMGIQAEVSGYQVLDCANSCALTNPDVYPEGFI